jgi:hypothetical protein
MPPVFPVATVPQGAPTFPPPPGGLFGAPRGSGAEAHKHQGDDIFAPYGAPVFAVVDGRIDQKVEKRGGVVVYLHGDDGDTYYYAHLAAWEGGPRDVRAGDVVGYVGQTGNSCKTGEGPLCSGATTTDAHLHFQHGHPAANWIDPLPFLSAATHVTVDNPPAVPAPPGAAPSPTPAPSPSSPAAAPTARLLAKALSQAYSDKHNGQAPPEAIRFAVAQAIAEGSLSSAYAGSNNVGSMHATDAFHKAHANDPGYGLLSVRDGTTGAYYITRLSIFPSLELGARAFLDLVERDVSDLADEDLIDADEYARRLYVRGYFAMGHPNRTPLKDREEAYNAGTETDDDDKNVDDYSRIIEDNLTAADAAIADIPNEPGDPSAVTVGPPFAPLFDRLSGKTGATLDDVKAALGPGADTPPAGTGGITLAEALSAPAGDGVWMFVTGPVPAVSPEVRAEGPERSPRAPGTSSSSSKAGAIVALLATVLAGAGATYALTRKEAHA